MEKISKDRIINIVQKLIIQNDKTDITLNEIANELHITHAALYKYFRNKQELWEAVNAKWLEENVLLKINVDMTRTDRLSLLHDWIKQFMDAKRNIYFANPKMFELSTMYIEHNPFALHNVLTLSYPSINQILGLDDPEFIEAENIMSAFAIFGLPDFAETWNDDFYDQRFENMWNLIKYGVKHNK
ncbi:MAG: TetR/AcrR family transcriptional regulator [Apilactobacillus sp.]|uniref:TetR/AcrR family transcriptional regulator n=1 Tax=Apilactobacillus TaxID=2767877 RepID=UPI0025FD3E38|nr:TetR/AcrR family transcriptional regulator [Apilactobacillus sp.]MCT6822928.1 TetR/AcrR family transcriptional regulator [Apilactobacillus sp.]MCT6858316.1 TetR/AcrR family transcriptional regulator [Apilactobacillus sp.]